MDSVKLKRFLLPLAFLVIGVAMTFLAGGTDDLVAFVGIVLIALAGVIAIALVFLEVGESEDRDRRAGRG
jgi:hypothetical protein